MLWMNAPLCLFAFFKLWTLQQFYVGDCMRCLSSAQAGSRFSTNLFVFVKGHGCLEQYRNFHFTRILLHFANNLRIILAFLWDHCGVGLQLILTWLDVLLYHERISKKQDGSLVGRTPSFCGEYSQLFIHKLCAFLGCSNHKQFFLFEAFASSTSAPSLEKSCLRPWEKHLPDNALSVCLDDGDQSDRIQLVFE